MNQMVRRKQGPCHELTAEDRDKMRQIYQKWHNVSVQTGRVDPEAVTRAVKELYAALGAGDPQVVIVPSPMAAAFAFGALAAKAYGHPGDKTWEAVHLAVVGDEVRQKSTPRWNLKYNVRTEMLVDAIMMPNNGDADLFEVDPRLDARNEAEAKARREDSEERKKQRNPARWEKERSLFLDKAIEEAVKSATYWGMRSSNPVVGSSAAACYDVAEEFGIGCAEQWSWNAFFGSAWDGIHSFFEISHDVLGLKTSNADILKKDAALSRLTDWRIMHWDFCVVSDLPEILEIDADDRPHSEIGPSLRWRDGWELYHWHGIRVPGSWILEQANLTSAEVEACESDLMRQAGREILAQRG